MYLDENFDMVSSNMVFEIICSDAHWDAISIPSLYMFLSYIFQAYPAKHLEPPKLVEMVKNNPYDYSLRFIPCHFM